MEWLNHDIRTIDLQFVFYAISILLAFSALFYLVNNKALGLRLFLVKIVIPVWFFRALLADVSVRDKLVYLVNCFAIYSFLAIIHKICSTFNLADFYVSYFHTTSIFAAPFMIESGVKEYSITTWLLFYFLFNMICFMLFVFTVKEVNHRNMLMRALLTISPVRVHVANMEPLIFKQPWWYLDVTKDGFHDYVVKTNLPVSKEEFFQARDQIENVVGGTDGSELYVPKIECEQAGKYRIQVAQPPVVTKEETKYSAVKLSDLKPYPTHKKHSDTTVPIGNAIQTHYHNWRSRPHVGVVGPTNWGKTTFALNLLMQTAKLQAQYAYFICTDMMNVGAEFRNAQWNHHQIKNQKGRRSDQTLLQYAQTCDRNHNFQFVSGEEDFINTVNALVEEINIRKHIIQQEFNAANIYDLYDRSKFDVDGLERFPPEIYFCIDEFSLAAQLNRPWSSKKEGGIEEALRLIDPYMVSFARKYGVHIIMLAQDFRIGQETFSGRRQVELYLTGVTKDQHEYMLGIKERGPKIIGHVTFSDGDSLNVIFAPSDANVDTFAAAITDANDNFSQLNRDWAMRFKARCASSSHAETIEEINRSQNALFKQQIQEPVQSYESINLSNMRVA